MQFTSTVLSLFDLGNNEFAYFFSPMYSVDLLFEPATAFLNMKIFLTLLSLQFFSNSLKFSRNVHRNKPLHFWQP